MSTDWSFSYWLHFMQLNFEVYNNKLSIFIMSDMHTHFSFITSYIVYHSKKYALLLGDCNIYIVHRTYLHMFVNCYFLCSWLIQFLLTYFTCFSHQFVITIFLKFQTAIYAFYHDKIVCCLSKYPITKKCYWTPWKLNSAGYGPFNWVHNMSL